MLAPRLECRARRIARGSLAAAVIAIAAAFVGPAETVAWAETPPPSELGSAPEDVRSIAKASYERAERAAAERRFAEALEAYERAASVDPSAPFTPAARARAAYLAARAEGGFMPLARLEEVRRDPARAADRAVIEALARDAEAFPPGRVRLEARLLVAESLWHKLREPRRAVEPLEQVLQDPAADDPTRGLALSELVGIYRELDDLGSAREVVLRYPDILPSLRGEVIRLERRRRLRLGAIAGLSALAVVGAVSLVRAARAMGLSEAARAIVRPVPLAFALYIGGAGAIVVRLHGSGDVRPFLLLGLFVAVIDAIARAWRLGSRDDRPASRAARAVACAAGVLAAGFLALERTEAGYLASFGL